MNDNCRNVALVLSGGLGLGAYQAGAYEALVRDGRMNPSWVAGSSVGAINGALIAGSDTPTRVETLREFWSAGDLWLRQPSFPGSVGHAQNWLNVLHTRLFGAAGHFRPRFINPFSLNPFSRFRSLYDLSPLRMQLDRLVDFGRLNSGGVRFSVAATDIQTGELLIFDTSRDQIAMDHLLASCGFLPEFAPVEIDGRLLGDGGLSANVPIEAITRGNDRSVDLLFVVDLFARDGTRPNSLEDALARKNDLVFGNQTLRRLESYAETGRLPPVIYLSYRPVDEEAGPEKTFDLSRGTIAVRWASGVEDMKCALDQLERNPRLQPLTMIRRASSQSHFSVNVGG